MTALRRVTPAELPDPSARGAVDDDALAAAREIVTAVRDGGEPALRQYNELFDGVEHEAPLALGPGEMRASLERISAEARAVLERTADRIRAFAEAQRGALASLDVPVPGGRAGHDVEPMERAGCYAPGGRFPLPSSVLMTAIPARVAGVGEVWVASPNPADVTVAAAAVAGADGLLMAGGAQAIAALAYGAGPVPACDVVVGPGNRFVTAAKQIVAGQVAIDMLAGPSELVVLADGSADPGVVAADLLAQAEHDPLAMPALIATDPALADRVDAEIARQLADLPTAETASAAIETGFAVVAADLDEAIALCDRLAPEHLEIHLAADVEEVARRCRHYGAAFLGHAAAEVLGDYGAGPNHTLPTGGTARTTGGLSVFTFLRVRTWLRIDDLESAKGLVSDAEALAELEGLAGHARSARRRRGL